MMMGCQRVRRVAAAKEGRREQAEEARQAARPQVQEGHWFHFIAWVVRVYPSRQQQAAGRREGGVVLGGVKKRRLV